MQVTELKSATPLINIMFSNRWRFSEIITNLSRAIIKWEYQTKMRYKYSNFEIRITTLQQKKKNTKKAALNSKKYIVNDRHN